jgi:DNA polymerase-3 subunit beta
MKFSTAAGKLAPALVTATALVETKVVKRLPVYGAVRLSAGDGAITISLNNGDAKLALTIAAEVAESGEIAVNAERLAALVAGFPAGAGVTIASDATTVVVSSGRSRFRLPVFPVTELPTLALIGETGRAILTREQAAALFARPMFAIATETTRYYLNGILLHDAGADLVAVATDGHRLARVVVPGCGGLSQDCRLIVPLAAVKIIIKLLKAAEAEAALTLRRSQTLFEIAGTGFTFVSKLIDGTFPDYSRVMPSPSGNSVVVDRAELARTLERIEAVAPETKGAPTVGLTWTAGEPALRVCVPGWPDLADDPIAAEVNGSRRVAFKVAYGIELLEALAGERICIDATDSTGSPILINDPDKTDDLIIVQMPCTWFERSEAAA